MSFACRSALCVSLLVSVVACGTTDPVVDEPTPTPSESPTATPDPTPAPEPLGNFVITSSAPAENVDIFRTEFDPATGETYRIQLTDSVTDDRFHALSQDGEWLYYSNTANGSSDIFRRKADGSDNPMNLTPQSSNETFVALSTDGVMIYYLSDEGGTLDLWRMSAKTGTMVENLSNADDDLVGVYAILPNESGAIVGLGDNANDPDGIDRDLELYFVSFESKSLVRLTDDRVITRFEGVADTGEVVFRRFEDADNDGVTDGPSNLWVVSVADGVERRLTEFTSGTSCELMAIEQATGHAIFEHRDGLKQIYSVNLTGTPDVLQLTDPPAGESSYFRVLSADGSRVIYTTNDNPGGFGDTEVYSVPVLGGDSTLLTAFDNDSYFMPVTHLPAQNVVLYESPVDGDTDIYSVPIGGGAPVNLTNNTTFSDDFRGTSADGMWLFYSNISDGYADNPLSDQDIYVIPTDGSGEPLQLTDNLVYDVLHASVFAD